MSVSKLSGSVLSADLAKNVGSSWMATIPQVQGILNTVPFLPKHYAGTIMELCKFYYEKNQREYQKWKAEQEAKATPAPVEKAVTA